MNQVIEFLKHITLSDLANVAAILTPLVTFAAWVKRRREDDNTPNSSGGGGIYSMENILQSRKVKENED